MSQIEKNFLFNLFEKLLSLRILTQGTLALAAELVSGEYFKGNEGSLTDFINAGLTALSRIGLSSEVSREENHYLFKIKKCKQCFGEEFCPIPFYLGKSISILSNVKAYPLRFEEKFVEIEDNICKVKIRVRT